MKAWSLFYPDVLPSVIGCPAPMLDHALLRAAQSFFTKSQVWKLWLDNVTTTLGVTDYDLELESNSELVKLERATLDGRPITVTTPEVLPADWQTSQLRISDCIFTVDRKTVTLLPTPTTAGLVLRIEAVLKPSNAATGIEDYLFDNYNDTIATVATAELLKKPGMPWTNMVLGQEIANLANDKVSAIAFQKWRAFSAALPRARVRTF